MNRRKIDVEYGDSISILPLGGGETVGGIHAFNSAGRNIGSVFFDKEQGKKIIRELQKLVFRDNQAEILAYSEEIIQQMQQKDSNDQLRASLKDLWARFDRQQEILRDMLDTVAVLTDPGTREKVEEASKQTERRFRSGHA